MVDKVDKAEDRPNPLKFQTWADKFLSDEEIGEQLSDLVRHPSWYVIPQLLEQLLEKTRMMLEDCPPEKVQYWQAHSRALKDIVMSLENAMAANTQKHKLKQQGGKVY